MSEKETVGLLETMLLEVLERSLSRPKEYRDIVEDGGAMQRLQQSPDFKRYQRLMAETYLALVERLRLADPATLTALQGTLVEHHMLMKLPAKVLDVAATAVERHRQDSEQTAV